MTKSMPFLRARVYTCLCVLLLSSIGPVFAQQPEQSAARLKLTELTKVVELRSGLDSVPKEVVALYQNTGTAPLTVSVKSVSCGCTKAVIETPLLEPGQEGRIKLELEEKKFKKDGTVMIQLATNDPEQKEAYLQLEVKWIPPVSVTGAGLLQLGLVPTGEQRKAAVALVQNFGDVPLSVDIKSLTGNCLAVGVSEGTKGSLKTFSCEITFAAVNPPGPFREEAILQTNLTEPRDIVVPVSGIVVGDIEVDPWQIDFGRVPLGTTRDRRLRLLSSAEKEARFVSAYTNVPALRLSWDKNGKPTSITATFSATQAQGDIKGMIHLVSSSGQETYVPVTGTVVPAIIDLASSGSAAPR